MSDVKKVLFIGMIVLMFSCVSFVSAANVTSFNAAQDSMGYLNSTTLTAEVPDLVKTTPSDYTSDWDSDGLAEFYIAIDDVNNILQVYANASNTENNIYYMDLDNSTDSGCEFAGAGTCTENSNGTDIIFGTHNFFLGGTFFGTWNSTKGGWNYATISTAGSIVWGNVTGGDIGYSGNYTAYWNSSGNVTELVIDLNDAWIDNKNTYVMDNSNNYLYTIFKNLSASSDSTAPTVTLPNYTNATGKANTDMLTLNVSVVDAGGLTGAVCLFDINGTNESVSVDSGWCNSTSLNLTGLADGNNTIKVYVNDSSNNFALNDSYVVQIDTTAPTITFSCTPSSLYVGTTLTCSCSGIDAISGVSSTSYTASPSTSTTGSFTTTCTIVDVAGNSGTSTVSYTVSSSGGSGLGVVTYSGATFLINENQLEEGFSKKFSANNRFKIKVSNENHYVEVEEVGNSTAKIVVKSDPQEATLAIGDSRKFELDGDGVYDLLVVLNSIENNEANFTLKSISEKITLETEKEEDEKEYVAAGVEPEIEEEGLGNGTIGGIIGIIVILIFVGIAFFRKRK